VCTLPERAVTTTSMVVGLAAASALGRITTFSMSLSSMPCSSRCR
jgi:hypothetical protein